MVKSCHLDGILEQAATKNVSKCWYTHYLE